MKKLTKEKVVHAWLFSGLRDLFFAFQIDSPFRYEPFVNAMGFEKICKSYLLAENSIEYEDLSDDEAKKKINSLAKRWGHGLARMTDEIKKSIGNECVEGIMNQDFDGYTGNRLIKVMEAAYLECRYPVPKHIHEEFPIKGKSDVHWVPIASSGIEKLCFAFARAVIISLKERFHITVPKDRFDQIVNGDAGIRFCNLFLKDTPDDFLG